jgi:hypothetical protein
MRLAAVGHVSTSQTAGNRSTLWTSVAEFVHKSLTYCTMRQSHNRWVTETQGTRQPYLEILIDVAHFLTIQPVSARESGFGTMAAGCCLLCLYFLTNLVQLIFSCIFLLRSSHVPMASCAHLWPYVLMCTIRVGLTALLMCFLCAIVGVAICDPCAERTISKLIKRPSDAAPTVCDRLRACILVGMQSAEIAWGAIVISAASQDSCVALRDAAPELWIYAIVLFSVSVMWGALWFLTVCLIYCKDKLTAAPLPLVGSDPTHRPHPAPVQTILVTPTSAPLQTVQATPVQSASRLDDLNLTTITRRQSGEICSGVGVGRLHTAVTAEDISTAAHRWATAHSIAQSLAEMQAHNSSLAATQSPMTSEAVTGAVTGALTGAVGPSSAAMMPTDCATATVASAATRHSGVGATSSTSSDGAQDIRNAPPPLDYAN